MAYGGPTTDVAASTASASQGTRGTAYVGLPQTPANEGQRAADTAAAAEVRAPSSPGTDVAREGPVVTPAPAPSTEAPRIEDWDPLTFAAASPLGEASRTMPSANGAGTVGG